VGIVTERNRTAETSRESRKPLNSEDLSGWEVEVDIK
jgi:hypothetical protein